MTATGVSRFETGSRVTDYSGLVQLTNVGEERRSVFSWYLVEHPEGLVLFDTGLSYDLVRDPHTYGRFGAPFLEEFCASVEMSEADTPPNRLAEVGVAPEEVDCVVLSHLHMDHAGNLEAFPDAEFVVQRRELEHAWWPYGLQRRFYLDGDFGVLRSPAYDVLDVDGEYDVFGDDSVVCLPTPGHTPGHQSLRVELAETGTVVLGADLAHLQYGYEEELLPPFDWHAEQAVKSIRDVKRLERRTDATVFLTHDVDDARAMPEPPARLE